MKFDNLDIAELRRRRGEKWSIYGPEVLPAWVADMDFPVCDAIQQMLEERLGLADFGYPREDEIDRLREAFAARALARYDWEVEPSSVEPLSDVVQGLYIALHAFSGPGDGAIVQTPIYPPFLHAVPECERRLIVNPLVHHPDGYEIDFDHLKASVQPTTKTLLFCNPHNPTGRSFGRRELESLAEIAIEHDLVVCSDEIHADLVLPGCTHRPLATVSPEIARRTVTLTSATKAFNIAGLRCAVAVFGSGELQRRFNAYPAHLRGGLGSLGIAATLIAWREGQPWLDQALAYLDDNRRLVATYCEDRFPGIECVASQATYLAWLDCRRAQLSPDPYRFFLERGRVALSDGLAFGPQGRGFVRLNFATSRTILSEILERMSAALSSP